MGVTAHSESKHGVSYRPRRRRRRREEEERNRELKSGGPIPGIVPAFLTRYRLRKQAVKTLWQRFEKKMECQYALNS
jgi:hypothetical protein